MRIPQLNLKELLIGACIDDAKIFLLDQKFIDPAFTYEQELGYYKYQKYDFANPQKVHFNKTTKTFTRVGNTLFFALNEDAYLFLIVEMGNALISI